MAGELFIPKNVGKYTRFFCVEKNKEKKKIKIIY